MPSHISFFRHSIAGLAMPQSTLLAVACCLVTGCEHDIHQIKDSTVEPPIIERFSPLAGLAGSTPVRIEGRNFDSGARVFFGTKQALFAIGPQYEYTSTTLYAIPPLGTPLQVEIRVKGNNGEAASSTLFRVLDGEPEITGLSSERITFTDTLTLYGDNFNPDDTGATLSLGGSSISDFIVKTDRVVTNLDSTSDPDRVGTGWKLLRFGYTPYEEEGASEVTVPVYVVQTPHIIAAEGDAHAGAVIRVWIDGFDDYRPAEASADNGVTVGGRSARILGFDYADLDTCQSYPDPNDGARVQVEALVEIPDLATGSHDLRASNRAGAAEDFDIWIDGRGSLYGEATPLGSSAILDNLEAPIAVAERGDAVLVATLQSPSLSPFVPRGRIYQYDIWGSTELIYDSATEGGGIPVALISHEWSDVISAHYRVAGSQELTFLRHWKDQGTWQSCPLGTASMPVVDGFGLTDAFYAGNLDVRIHRLSPPTGCYGGNWAKQPRVFATVSGQLWSAIYELRAFGERGGLDCPGVIEPLDNIVSFAQVTDQQPPVLADVVASESARVLYGLVELETAGARAWAVDLVEEPDPDTGLLAATPLSLSADSLPARLIATPEGLIHLDGSSIAGYSLERDAAAGLTVSETFSAGLPDQGCSSYVAECAPVSLSPNGRELFVGAITDDGETTTVPVCWRIMRVSARTGIFLETVEAPENEVFTGFLHSANGEQLWTLGAPWSAHELEAYATSNSSWVDVLR